MTTQDTQAVLLAALNRAEEGAGTLPAKEAVKLRPADWKALADAIRAAQAKPAADAVAVKGLEWITFCSASGNCDAKTPFGKYVIQSEADGWCLFNEDDASSVHSTLDAAKAAAQADYEARIRSALISPVAPEGSEPVAWRGVVDGRTAFLCRTDDEIKRLASDYNAIIEPLYAAPATPVEGLSEWCGWDQSNLPWSESHHKDDVLAALFRGPWSVEDAATLIGFIDSTWTRAAALSQEAGQ